MNPAPGELGAYISSFSDLPHGELAWLKERGVTRLVPAGAMFCAIGQTEHEIGYLEQGIVQVGAVSAGGGTVVLDFQFAGSWVAALDTALQRLPSEVCIQAITPCRIQAWPYELRHEAYQRHRGWLQLGLHMAEQAFRRKHRRYVSLRTRTARERFADLAAEFPEEWRTIPQHLIASYLNITPQYLSVLRRAERRAMLARPSDL